MLDDLNDARNALNVVVLDACRDNPFGWARSGSRGLVVVSRQPADSIIVYATSAGSTASDGTGRNGFFTTHLLTHLKTPGLEVKEIFNLTGADVARASGNQQRPAIYSQFFNTAYLGAQPAPQAAPAPVEQPVLAQITPQPGTDPTPRQPERPERVKPDPKPKKERSAEKDPSKHFWSLGASVGSSMAAPWLIGTIRGTIAPFRNQFFEIGFDYGKLCGNRTVGYYSMYPNVNYAFFLPMAEKFSWYIGAGGGFMFGRYDFYEGSVPIHFFAAQATTGFNLFDSFNISYTIRTNFSGVSNRASVGYAYRFK